MLEVTAQLTYTRPDFLAAGVAPRTAEHYTSDQYTALLLAGILHDIGKRPGVTDHAREGARHARAVLTRMGFDPQIVHWATRPSAARHAVRPDARRHVLVGSHRRRADLGQGGVEPVARPLGDDDGLGGAIPHVNDVAYSRDVPVCQIGTLVCGGNGSVSPRHPKTYPQNVDKISDNPHAYPQNVDNSRFCG